MANSIGQVCSREVVFATRETTVAAAAKRMRQHHVGSLVVVEDMDGGKRVPIGLVTDRDIMMEITAMGLDPAVITVGDIMDPEVVTARESEGVLETMEIMRYKGVRRLPIVGADGQLVGIVTIDDLLEILAEELGELTKIVAREQSREASTRK
ncbi:MAG: CBS domain-containing protein [Betaproteobacteria bacterium]|nr:CBS domain-containing protein [Betaproteobacteria bacterium]